MREIVETWRGPIDSIYVVQSAIILRGIKHKLHVTHSKTYSIAINVLNLRIWLYSGKECSLEQKHKFVDHRLQLISY